MQEEARKVEAWTRRYAGWSGDVGRNWKSIAESAEVVAASESVGELNERRASTVESSRRRRRTEARPRAGSCFF